MVAKQRSTNRANMAESRQSSEAALSSVQKKIKAAFELFVYDLDNRVDVREISTIIYSLGCFPSQADIRDFIAEVEEDQSGYVHLDKFLPPMTKVLMENKFPPVPEERVCQAFEALDKENKGYLTAEELTKYMTQEGEVFSQNEIDEMLNAFTNPEKNNIQKEDLINHLCFYTEK